MIKVGDTLVLEPKFSQQHEQYKSTVVEINDQSIFIDYPINASTGKRAFLIDGTQLKITLVAAKKAIYVFDTEVLGRVKERIAMIQLSHPPKDSIIKIQRREFVRVETAIDTVVHPQASEFQPFKAITEDISAGGTALLISKDIILQSGSSIFVWFALPLKSGEIHYFKVKSKVIRISEEKERFNILSIEFTEMSEGDRQTLIRYIFEREVEMKKKRLSP
ncbi:flagellar brake protein [Bacillus sp. V59.32b]|uniref:flagellar brake protein n=1 Tax=Bacillus sp. V59.32b TaxID=1758642 RepID=UPI000E3E26D6|nr:flagellar brake domain-containing protein [Bacillus sp. V59.32b]RFU69078.1 pilus assembly protein PilZ [Bacillus sp. V59.32b]